MKVIAQVCVVCRHFGGKPDKSRTKTWCNCGGECRTAGSKYGIGGVALHVMAEKSCGHKQHVDPAGRSCFRRWHEDLHLFHDVRTRCATRIANFRATAAAAGAGARAGAGGAGAGAGAGRSRRGRPATPAGKRRATSSVLGTARRPKLRRL